MSLTSEVGVCVTEQNILFLFGVDLGQFLMYLLPRVHNLQRVSNLTIIAETSPHSLKLPVRHSL